MHRKVYQTDGKERIRPHRVPQGHRITDLLLLSMPAPLWLLPLKSYAAKAAPKWHERAPLSLSLRRALCPSWGGALQHGTPMLMWLGLPDLTQILDKLLLSKTCRCPCGWTRRKSGRQTLGGRLLDSDSKTPAVEHVLALGSRYPPGFYLCEEPLLKEVHPSALITHQVGHKLLVNPWFGYSLPAVAKWVGHGCLLLLRAVGRAVL